MIKKYITTKNVWIFIILLTLITSLIIPILRVISDKPIILGEKPYYDIRIAETVLEEGLEFRDNLVLDGRDYIVKPYHFVLASLFYFFKPENSLIAISLITGLFSVIFFYLILKKLKINLYQRFFTFVVLLLSPAFIFTFGTANEFCISIMLLLLGTYLFLKSDRLFIYSLLVFSIATIFNLLNVIIIIFLLLFLLEIGIPKKREAHLILAFVLILALIYYAPLYFYSGFASKTELVGRNTITDFISDLGGEIGISIFTLILGIVGIIFTWKYKQKLKNSYILMLLLLFISYSFNYAVVYLNFIFSIFAGIAFAYIAKGKWEIKPLRKLTLLFLIYGLLFSSISYIERTFTSEPDKDIQKALEWLNDNSNNGDIVFSHYSKGFWIEYWADIPVVTDSLFDYNDAKQKLKDSNTLLYSRNIETIIKLMDKYEVKYVFVDNTMKNGQVWSKKEGLWYAFRNNKTFKNIYYKNQVEILEYIGKND